MQQLPLRHRHSPEFWSMHAAIAACGGFLVPLFGRRLSRILEPAAAWLTGRRQPRLARDLAHPPGEGLCRAKPAHSILLVL